MPTYAYQCAACGHEFEKFESIKAKPSKDCPACKKKKAERQISGGAGFLFKGQGFYTTDYRSSSYKEAAKKDSSTTGSCGTGGCGKEACAKPSTSSAKD